MTTETRTAQHTHIYPDGLPCHLNPCTLLPRWEREREKGTAAYIRQLAADNAALLAALKMAYDLIIANRIDIQTDVLEHDPDDGDYFLCLDEVLAAAIAQQASRDA